MQDGSVSISAGSGNRFGNAVLIVCGVSSLVASLLSFVSIWFQLKNYRKPLLQRYVVRILLMVPIYAAASWSSLISTDVAFYVDPIRDIYEAFTIYTFFQLLINFLGGERSLIILMHGRPPVSHPWPLSHCLAKIDISDPHTFLAIKRGILQYAWLKPVLSIAIIVLKSTGTYQEGYLGLTSGYLWTGILYNASVTLSLYALAMFWVCMAHDLKPFRPVPKFLCVKLIIFASYWQGFFLSILQVLGAFPDVQGYTPDNLAAAIQDALICCEMPVFAVSHWYAFSWHDYADVTVSAARLPVKYALRDAFGPTDLIQDTRETFAGRTYEYRAFDAQDDMLPHAASDSRVARMRQGMRYSRTGGGKYWLPKPGEADGARQPLLGGDHGADDYGAAAAEAGGLRTQRTGSSGNHGAFSANEDLDFDVAEEDEELYAKARQLEFGDWNYPVLTAHVPSRERWARGAGPNTITTTTNRNLLHPTQQSRQRREKAVEEQFVHRKASKASKGRKESKDSKGKGKSRSRSSQRAGTSGSDRSRPTSNLRAPVVADLVRQDSNKSGRSQLVDLTVENEEAEEIERVRARKEGGAAWNRDEPQHFVRTYDDQNQGEDIRTGFERNSVPPDVGNNSGAGGDAAEDERERQGESHDRLSAPLDDDNPWRG